MLHVTLTLDLIHRHHMASLGYKGACQGSAPLSNIENSASGILQVPLGTESVVRLC